MPQDERHSNPALLMIEESVAARTESRPIHLNEIAPKIDRRNRLTVDWLRRVSELSGFEQLRALRRGIRDGDPYGSSELTSPLAISRLMALLLLEADSTPAENVSVLDIAAGAGFSLFSLIESAQLSDIRLGNVDGVDINPNATRTAETLADFLGHRARFRVSDSLIEDPFPDDSYNYVLSLPPLNLDWQRQKAEVQADKGYVRPLPPTGDATLLFVQRACRKLREDGRAALVVSTSSMTTRNAGNDRARQWLVDENLLDAVVYLPTGLVPGTNVPSVLLLVSKGRSSDEVHFVNASHLFESRSVGVLPQDTHRYLTDEHSNWILSELKTRRRSRHTISLPKNDIQQREWKLSRHVINDQVLRLTVSAPSEYSADDLREEWRSADRIEATTKIVCLLGPPVDLNPELVALDSKMARMSPRTLFDLALHPASDEEPSCGHSWIWFPSTANSRVVAGEQKTKRGWFLCLDPEVVIPEFAAAVLSSDLGKSERARFAPTMIPNVRKSEMLKIRVPCPDRSVQEAAVSADARMRAGTNSLLDLHNRLWDRPIRAQDVELELDVLLPRDTIDRWLDVLPYPLASTLWLALSTTDSRVAHRQLIRFFEATAEFLALFHLSAQLAARAGSPTEKLDFLVELRDSQSIHLKYTDFGSWNRIVASLGKAVRRTMDASGDEAIDDRARLSEGYGADKRLIDVISSKQLFRILDRARDYRNSRQGHEGRTTEAEAEAWAAESLVLVDELRALFGSIWAENRLIRPGSMVQKGGSWSHQVEALVGARYPFRSEKLNLDHPMDSDLLHVAFANSRKALPLLPLIRMRAPRDETELECFFFSRVDESGGLRYVSYNALKQSQIVESITIPDLEPLFA